MNFKDHGSELKRTKIYVFAELYVIDDRRQHIENVMFYLNRFNGKTFPKYASEPISYT